AFDATIRPDFSQIESDVVQLAVNSRFAIFYPEKRPFFMEGSDLLGSPIQAIHTRTITSPLWGARLTGRPGNHAYTLVVADDRGGGSVIVPGPAFSSLAPQPSDTLAVLGRYRYGHGRSSGGLLLTSRTSRDGAYANHVAGPDVLWWFSPADRLTAQWLASRTTEDGSTRGGHAATVAWDRTARSYAWNVTLRDFDANFRADSGFVPQSGVRSASARASLLRYPKSKWLSRLLPDLVGERIEERGGLLVSSAVYPRVYLEGWRATVAFFEYRENEKVRARDGSLHEQDYAYAMMRFLVSRRVPYLRLAARHGDELDVASARVGRGTALTMTATLVPVDRLQVDVTGENHRLGLGGRPLFDARMLRVLATWTFSQRAFVRGIAERRDVEWNEELAPGRTSSHGPLNGSLLFGYRINWQTSLYAGFVEGPQQEVFVKLSYAIHPTGALFRKEHS
ncbi:MAG TPA: DUF5916 domain-containing protein, partial [Thermoanaerobaculia bacterium]|nr:DUF5916 domain-containing protein [Thermoanaerobaculia bacterium]